MIVIGITALFIVAVLFDLPLLFKQKEQRKKVTVIYLFIIFTAYVIGILQVVHLEPPSPTVLIEKTIKIFLG